MDPHLKAARRQAERGPKGVQCQTGHEAPSRNLARLRSRLQKALGRGPTKSAPRSSKSARSRAARDDVILTLRPPPGRDGNLLVWREPFPADEVLSAPASSGVALEDMAFLDLETCGLGDTVVFLAGFLFCADRGPEIVQWLAPDPSREPELLERATESLREHSLWVSFNGRSFDVPRLGLRCRRHGIDPPPAVQHRDLLHEARRRWGHLLPDCRLSTLERSLLGLERLPGDVPGREVPRRYQDFVTTGDIRWVAPVVEHNRRDVMALAALLGRLIKEPAPEAGSPPRRPSLPTCLSERSRR